MFKLTLTMLVAALSMLAVLPAAAHSVCSTKALAGNWVFATAVGRQALGAPFPADKDITAIGTMNIDKYGNLEGVFDANVEELVDFPAPLHNIPYAGTLVVQPDCRGTLEFTSAAGTTRVDSIAVVNRGEILAMSQDPHNLWTYQIRRIQNRK